MNLLDQKRTLLISPEKIQKRVLEMGERDLGKIYRQGPHFYWSLKW